jgi:hypothetical protein
MRLEFLPDGSLDYPLIRLFDFTPAEAARLGAVVLDLAVGRAQRVSVHALPGVTAVDGCELVFRTRSWNQGIVRVGPVAFENGLTADTWDNVAFLIEPFACEGGGYQWLDGGPGEASLLLSVSGEW